MDNEVFRTALVFNTYIQSSVHLRPTCIGLILLKDAFGQRLQTSIAKTMRQYCSYKANPSQLIRARTHKPTNIRTILAKTPLRSLDWQVLFVPRVKTTMAQTRPFATNGPSLWNANPSSLCL